MKKTNRLTFGVIVTQAADIEQREILKGIIEQAYILNIDIAVLSNIYNPEITDSIFKCENEIYNLILSEDFDCFILISESFVNNDLRKKIKSNLIQKKDTPIVVIGTPLPELVLPNFFFINTSDEADIQDITDHLIETHGFTDIDILSGHENIKASHLRVNGYRLSLEKHDIPFDESKVHFGDFWMPSGEALAKKYLNGELPFPQAIICANDYMAYGMLDFFIKNGVQIPEKITVVGYEYIHERHVHTPILTTYQRNRTAIGKSAVRLLTDKLKNGEYSDFSPPPGTIIHGNTCSCGISHEQLNTELETARLKQMYDFLNLFSQFERRLTECCNLNEYISICQNFKYLIRNVDEVSLCLRDRWNEPDKNSNEMISYGIIPGRSPFSFQKNNLTALFGDSSSVYYFQPIFFSDRSLGYFVLRYNTPDTPDHIFRNWLKSASNGLEFLRMKNDIQYLTRCQNLSESYDSLTHLFNENGTKNAYRELTAANEDTENIFCIALRICLFEVFTEIDTNAKIDAIIDISDAVRELSAKNGIAGRVSNNLFICIIKNNNISTDILKKTADAVVIRHRKYSDIYGMNSFALCCLQCQPHSSFTDLINNCTTELDRQQQIISDQRIKPHFRNLLKIRNHLYANPTDTFSPDIIHGLYNYSDGHMRIIYKSCFNISFHQDCITARISLAKYLLLTSDKKLSEIIKACGYTDDKYFFRQFKVNVGITPHEFKQMLR